MCGTPDSSFQSSNTLNNTGVWSLIELVSLYTVPLSAVNGLSRLTTTSNGHWAGTADSKVMGRFENFRIGPSLSNRIGTADSNRIESRSLAGPYGKPAVHLQKTETERKATTTSKARSTQTAQTSAKKWVLVWKLQQQIKSQQQIKNRAEKNSFGLQRDQIPQSEIDTKI